MKKKLREKEKQKVKGPQGHRHLLSILLMMMQRKG